MIHEEVCDFTPRSCEVGMVRVNKPAAAVESRN